MQNTTIFGGAAIIGIMTAFWSKARALLYRCLSLFIVHVRIEGRYACKGIAMYCWQNFRRSPFGERRYRTISDYVQPLERYVQIGYECIGSDPILFWDGWRPLLLGQESSKDDSDDGGSTGEEYVVVTFLRGMWDIDWLISEALDQYNRIDLQEEEHCRFCITRIVGTMSKFGGDMHDIPEVSTEMFRFEKANKYGDRRLLQWNLEDIGLDRSTEYPSLSTLALTPEIEELLLDVRHWINSEEWYRERNIPWKRGWLLYGKPGTGKTALVRGVAEELNLPIWSFDLATLANGEFIECWRRMLERVPGIALLEDLDSVFKGRKNITRNALNGGLTFDCLLNCIDGVERTDGVLTILTTNDIEKLDPAFGLPSPGDKTRISTRPGRVDRAVEFLPLEEIGRRKIAQRILDEFPEYQKELIERGEGDTGAQFQERCTQIALRLHWNGNGNGKAKPSTLTRPLTARMAP